MRAHPLLENGDHTQWSSSSWMMVPAFSVQFREMVSIWSTARQTDGKRDVLLKTEIDTFGLRVTCAVLVHDNIQQMPASASAVSPQARMATQRILRDIEREKPHVKFLNKRLT